MNKTYLKDMSKIVAIAGFALFFAKLGQSSYENTVHMILVIAGTMLFMLAGAALRIINFDYREKE